MAILTIDPELEDLVRPATTPEIDPELSDLVKPSTAVPSDKRTTPLQQTIRQRQKATIENQVNAANLNVVPTDETTSEWLTRKTDPVVVPLGNLIGKMEAAGLPLEQALPTANNIVNASQNTVWNLIDQPSRIINKVAGPGTVPNFPMPYQYKPDDSLIFWDKLRPLERALQNIEYMTGQYEGPKRELGSSPKTAAQGIAQVLDNTIAGLTTSEAALTLPAFGYRKPLLMAADSLAPIVSPLVKMVVGWLTGKTLLNTPEQVGAGIEQTRQAMEQPTSPVSSAQEVQGVANAIAPLLLGGLMTKGAASQVYGVPRAGITQADVATPDATPMELAYNAAREKVSQRANEVADTTSPGYVSDLAAKAEVEAALSRNDLALATEAAKELKATREMLKQQPTNAQLLAKVQELEGQLEGVSFRREVKGTKAATAQADQLQKLAAEDVNLRALEERAGREQGQRQTFQSAQEIGQFDLPITDQSTMGLTRQLERMRANLAKPELDPALKVVLQQRIEKVNNLLRSKFVNPPVTSSPIVPATAISGKKVGTYQQISAQGEAGASAVPSARQQAVSPEATGAETLPTQQAAFGENLAQLHMDIAQSKDRAFLTQVKKEWSKPEVPIDDRSRAVINQVDARLAQLGPVPPEIKPGEPIVRIPEQPKPTPAEADAALPEPPAAKPVESTTTKPVAEMTPVEVVREATKPAPPTEGGLLRQPTSKLPEVKAAVERQKEAGKRKLPVLSKVFDRLFNDFYETKAKVGQKAAGTLRGYKNSLNTFLYYLGNDAVQFTGDSHFYNKMTAALHEEMPSSKGSVLSMLKEFHKNLEGRNDPEAIALAKALKGVNAVETPTHNAPREPLPMSTTLQVLRQLRETVKQKKGQEPALRTLAGLELSLTTGRRVGEINQMTYRDLDFKNNTVSLPVFKKGQPADVAPERRTFAVDPVAMGTIREYVELTRRQTAEQTQAADPAGRVFRKQNGESFVDGEHFNKGLKLALAAQKLPTDIVAHQFRGTFAKNVERGVAEAVGEALAQEGPQQILRGKYTGRTSPELIRAKADLSLTKAREAGEYPPSPSPTKAGRLYSGLPFLDNPKVEEGARKVAKFFGLTNDTKGGERNAQETQGKEVLKRTNATEPTAEYAKLGSESEKGGAWQALKDFSPMRLFDNYTIPMVERIRSFTDPVKHPNSQKLADTVNEVVNQTKRNYGKLTETLDPAKQLLGKGGPAVRELMSLKKGIYGGVRKIFAYQERGAELSPAAKAVNAVFQRSNQDIGNMGFKAAELTTGRPGQATGKLQRMWTVYGLNQIKKGQGPAYNNLVKAIHEFNPEVSVEKIDTMFKRMKAELDQPMPDVASLDRLNQEFVRIVPNTVTHIRHFGWQEVLVSDPFFYLEHAAQRNSAALAFRQAFPDPKAITDMRQKVMAELRTNVHEKEVDNLIKTVQGHPLDAYSLGFTSADSPIGGGASSVLQAATSIAKAGMLSSNFITNVPETFVGGPITFLGARRYLKVLGEKKYSYQERERAGMVNKQMYNMAFDPVTPARSAARIVGNTIRKWTFQQALNEVQEAQGALLAKSVADDIRAGKLSPNEQNNMQAVFRAMGFTKEQAKQAVRGKAPEIVSQFETKAAAWLSAGNQAMAERSRFGASKLFNNVFWFQSYSQMALNQFRGVAKNMVEDWQAGDWQSFRTNAKLFGKLGMNRTLQGAMTLAILMAAKEGTPDDLWDEAKDNPAKLALRSLSAAGAGPLTPLAGVASTPQDGRSQLVQLMMMSAPVSSSIDLYDAVLRKGQFKNYTFGEALTRFVETRLPIAKSARLAMSLSGLSEDNQEMTNAKNAFYRWRRDRQGYTSVGGSTVGDPAAPAIRRIKEAIEDGRDWHADAVGLDYERVATSLERGMTLEDAKGKQLTPEMKNDLIGRIGKDKYDMLVVHDAMLREIARQVRETKGVEAVPAKATGNLATDVTTTEDRRQAVAQRLSPKVVEFYSSIQKDLPSFEPTVGKKAYEQQLTKEELPALEAEFAQQINQRLDKVLSSDSFRSRPIKSQEATVERLVEMARNAARSRTRRKLKEAGAVQ